MEPDNNLAYSNLTELDKELPYQLIGVGCDYRQLPVDRPFGYPTYQWIQSFEGCGVFHLEGRELPVPVGHGMLIYPGDIHSYQEVDGPWYVNWITFNGYHIERMLDKLGLTGSGVYPVSDPALLESHFRRAFRILKSGFALTGLDGSVLVYQLMLDLYRCVQTDDRSSRIDRAVRLKPVFDHIRGHLEGTITVDELAKIIGITPQHFCILFKDVTGLRPVEYINSQRIREAKDLLVREPALRVSEVGRRVGFENNSYFSTIFRRFEGISPRRYKELH